MFQNNIFIFLDESGEMNFSVKSSKHTALAGLTISKSVNQIIQEYWFLRHDLYINPIISTGSHHKYTNKRFHASEDPQAVRDRVFELISDHIDIFRVRSLIIEKVNVYDCLKTDEWLYQSMYYYLVRSILQDCNWTENVAGVQFIIDYNQTKRFNKAIERGIYSALKNADWSLPFQLHHSPSGCHPFLQLTDYFCWAIYRKYESSGRDLRSYNLIVDAIEDEWKMI